MNLILYIHFTYGTPFCILAVISGGRGAIHEVMVDHRRAGVVFFVVIAQIADVIVQWLGIRCRAVSWGLECCSRF